uniref:DUF7869 domain-containing protein n=1 Tax=Bactrocera latifrons TaxID=174628 RepID=A0A0K8TWY0_BACLA
MALPLPGRLPKFKDFRIMKLPSSKTKSSIYRKYIYSLSDAELKMSNRSFRRIWSKYIPYVTVMKPADDLCDVCREILTVVTAVVLSFDFDQTVHYPASPQQPGTAYFKATKRCGVFGITDEKQKVQYNYMLDEKDDVGKGPNCFVSILHYHLETYYKDTETLVLLCDNCVGQNKNNTVLSYLQWRLARGLNKTILFNFLLTGHTKFAPDRYFGIVKSKYAVSNIDTYAGLL